jgi:hypothetical protein
MKTTFVFALLACAALAACSVERQRDEIRHGLLTMDLSQDAFLAVWGAPTRTSVVHSEEDVIKAGLNSFGGSFSKGKEIYEVWNYDNRNTVLVFDDHELVAWSTPKTVQELAAPRQ